MQALEWEWKLFFQNTSIKAGKVDLSLLEESKCGYGGMSLETHI